MISGPFVLRKTKAAQSAPVQVQPAKPVARVDENAGPRGDGLILKPLLQGGAIGLLIMSGWMSIMGMILNSIEAGMFGLFFVMIAMAFGCLSMAVD